jgi:hypothetical protein
MPWLTYRDNLSIQSFLGGSEKSQDNTEWRWGKNEDLNLEKTKQTFFSNSFTFCHCGTYCMSMCMRCNNLSCKKKSQLKRRSRASIHSHSPLQCCQMVYFQTQNPNLGKFWNVLQLRMLLLLPLCSTLRQNGIFYFHLVCCTEKNLATLLLCLASTFLSGISVA